MLEVESLSVDFETREGSVAALRDVSFGLKEGEFLSVVGASGCGKSTLLKVIAGLQPATSGRVTLDAKAITAPHRDVGLLFQQPVLLRWRNVLENVLLPIEYLRRPLSDYRGRALDLLRQVGLEGFESRMPHQLSGGMQQRVALARALIYDPRILLMDEPFAALDALTREEMAIELLRIWEVSRKSVIFVTHSIPEAVMLSDRVLAMSARPGTIAKTVAISLRRPRSEDAEYTDTFAAAVHEIRDVIYARRHATQPAGGQP
jgi:NitT/TauT family transport system ATP-binding protein